MPIQLHEDFQDILNIFNEHKVRYIIVGGYAVIHHGYNRNTGDLDIWVDQTEENFELLKDAFSEFGLPTDAIQKEEFLNNEMDVYTFGRPPVCIEILTRVKGLQFADTYKQAITVQINNVAVVMIDIRDLIAAKRAAGRYKDLDDIEHLSS